VRLSILSPQERRKVIDHRRRIAAELRGMDNDHLAATEPALQVSSELAEPKANDDRRKR